MADTLPDLASASAEKLVPALQLYSRLGKLTDLPVVLSFVNNPRDDVRITAAKTASAIIKENLITYYHQMEKEVRRKLALLLESLDPKIIDDISQDLYSDNPERRITTVQLLGLLRKNPRIVDICTTLLKDRDSKVRATAVVLLGNIIGPNDFSVILSLLGDSDNRVRANTIEALEKIGNKRFVPLLLRFRNDTNNRIRGNALKALYQLGYTDIEHDLSDMLSSANDYMKATALWVITQVRHASPLLEDAAGRHLLSDNEMVKSNAHAALSKLDTPRSQGYLRYLTL